MPRSQTSRKPSHTAMDEATRVRMGANTGSTPDMLMELATDPEATVRAAVAMNTRTPIEADRLLALDGDEQVRSVLAGKLAGKLASTLPDLRAADRARRQKPTLDILAKLAADDAVVVRTALSEAVKDMPEAPHTLIIQLAQDEAVPVNTPVIRQSPVLTTNDLLQLLGNASNRSAAIANAVAGRAGLNATVADAVACSADATAISTLLANHSATIRAATLQALATARRPDWQQLLTDRPGLPAALSEFLTGRPRVPDLTINEAIWQVRNLASRGGLDEPALLAAASRGQENMVTAMLAVAAHVSAEVVKCAVTLRDAKALVSLVWRAGFSMQAAVPLQILLTRTPPGSVLRGGPGGSFPLVPEEMCWQINVLQSMAR